MGFEETLNSDLTPSSKSNNIDVHFMRNTEYGAMAILSASIYGNTQTLQNSTIKSTTGNVTGIYFNNDTGEYVAGVWHTIWNNIDSRYYDSYSYVGEQKVGDATGDKDSNISGCKGWHDATTNVNEFVGGNYNIYFRGCSYEMFRYGGGSHNSGSMLFAHAVASCGEGL